MHTDRSATFGEMLHHHRFEIGLTQEELAERARLSVRAISDLERGVKTRPHLATIRQLAEALQLSDEERGELQRAARGQALSHRGSDSAGRAAAGVHTFLIADVRGYTQFTLEQGDEAAAHLAKRFAQLVEGAVAAWDGRVIELRGDEALVVFSSARQSLRAALEVQARLDEEGDAFPLGVGIGLDSGEAISVAGGYRGAALNLAARLCSLAKAGEVLASEGVIHLARKVDGLTYAERGLVPLKGFADPVRVVQVTVSARPSLLVDQEPEPGGKQRLPIGGFLGSLPSGALVAREEELRRMVVALEAVEAEQGRLVLLAGEPGIGKTRLAQELTRVANDRGFLVAAGRCYQPQQSVPYSPFLDALGMAYMAAPAAIRDNVPHRWPYLTRLLPDQLGSDAPPSSESPEEQQRLFRAVSAFVLALADLSPVALLLDDLHWADSASLQLLQHLARATRAGHVLLLGTYRDVEVYPEHPLESTLRDLSREQVMERVSLKRLGESDTSTFIEETMGRLEPGPEFATLVHQHTDGNPFFTQQVLQALVENGSIYQENGAWKRRAIGEIEVPESVRSVIAQRVSRLQPEAQEVLQEASVLGPAFIFDDLLQMKSPNGDADLEDAVDVALADAASVGLVRVTGKDRYAFDHALTQQALYATLSPRRRRRLHLAAGEAMETLSNRARNQRAAELAWHFLQGDSDEKAIQYSLLAGDQAESVFAHAEAERRFRTALELAHETDDPLREAEAAEKLGIVLMIAGRYEEAREILERAARIRQQRQDVEGEGRIMARIGLLCHLSGSPEEGIRLLQPLADRLEPLGASHSLALIYAALVRLFDHTGRQSDQLRASQRLLMLARGLQDERLLVEAELHQGVSLMHMGQYDEALRLLESAIPRAESVGDLHTICIALGFCAIVHHSRHEVDQAYLYHERAVEVAQRLGDPREISHRAVEAAYFTFLIGDWRSSQAYAERAVTNALELDSLRAFVQPLYTLAELSLYTGAWDDASGYLQECITIAEHLRLTDHLREVQALLAEKDLLEENPHAALDRLRPLLDTPGWEEHLNFLLILVSTRLAVGDVDGAGEAAAKATAEVARQRLPIPLVDALRVQGAIATQRDAWEEAETHLQHAVKLARDITYPWGEARALYEFGLLSARRGEGDRAREQLELASAIFRKLGAEPYQARSDRAIAAQGR